jgi:hypothetical protein
MKKHKHYVGLDVHNDTIAVAIAEAGRGGEVRSYGTITNTLDAFRRLVDKIGGESIELHVAYEAGPTGFVLCRWMKKHGIDCIVVAPSKTPQGPGPRQKTDQRDALQLARLHRAGELTAIHVPDETDEAIRDLTRARADAVADLTRAKNRLKGFLLRNGYRCSVKANWSDAHMRYLRQLSLPIPIHSSVLEECLLGSPKRWSGSVGSMHSSRWRLPSGAFTRQFKPSRVCADSSSPQRRFSLQRSGT